MAARCVTFDDDTPAARKARACVAHLILAYTGGKAAYEAELTRVAKEVFASADGDGAIGALQLLKLLHASVLISEAAVELIVEHIAGADDVVQVLDAGIEEGAQRVASGTVRVANRAARDGTITSPAAA